MSEPIYEQLRQAFGLGAEPQYLLDPREYRDWDVNRHGRMRDHATTPDDEPATVPYDPDAGR